MQNQLTPFDAARREIMSPAMRSAFDAALVDKRISFERESAFALQILQQSDYLCKVAMGCPMSLTAAINNIASIGISLNPAKKQAYLVPRKGRVCLDISYLGLLDLAVDTGSILWGQANVVRAADKFSMRAIGELPEHQFDPFSPDRGEIVGSYCVVKTADNSFLTTAMSIKEINDIRDRSEAWKSYMKDKSKVCPWVTDFPEMANKTVVKKASKYWPKKNVRLEEAIHHLNTDGGEGLERDMGNAVQVVDVEAHKKHIDTLQTEQEVREYWKKCADECRLKNDAGAGKDLRSAVEIRIKELKQ